jgi:hypothetical protein
MKNINRLTCCSLFLLSALLGSTAIGQATDADCAEQFYAMAEQFQHQASFLMDKSLRYGYLASVEWQANGSSKRWESLIHTSREALEKSHYFNRLWKEALYEDTNMTCDELYEILRENPEMKLPSVDKTQNNAPKQQDIKKSVQEPENQLQSQQAIRDLTKDMNEIFEYIEGKTNKDKKTDQVRKTLEKPTYDVYESPDLQREGFDMDEEEAISLWNQAAEESELEPSKTSPDQSANKNGARNEGSFFHEEETSEQSSNDVTKKRLPNEFKDYEAKENKDILCIVETGSYQKEMLFGTLIDNGKPDGKFGEGDYVLVRKNDRCSIIAYDKQSQVSTEVSLPYEGDGRIVSNYSGSHVYTESMPHPPLVDATGNKVDPYEFLSKYTTYKEAEFSAEKYAIDDAEITNALFDYGVKQPVIDLVTGELLGMAVDGLVKTGVGRMVGGKPDESIIPVTDVIGDVSTIVESVKPEFEIFTRDLDEDKLVKYYMTDGKYHLSGQFGHYEDPDSWSQDKLREAAKERASQFTSYIRSRESALEAFDELMKYYPREQTTKPKAIPPPVPKPTPTPNHDGK